MRQLFMKFIMAVMMMVFFVSAMAFTDHRETIQKLVAQTQYLDKSVLNKALMAFQEAQEKGIPKNNLLTVIDYSKPSTTPRLWVFDLSKTKLLYEEYVSHGSGSGELYAKKFSNKPESHQSSVGLFVTENPYYGKNGYSLRVKGLEEINDLAKERGIVVHGGDYVNADYIRRYGRAGRSHGCFVVNDKINRELINTIKDGSLIYVHPPRKKLFGLF